MFSRLIVGSKVAPNATSITFLFGVVMCNNSTDHCFFCPCWKTFLNLIGSKAFQANLILMYACLCMFHNVISVLYVLTDSGWHS